MLNILYVHVCINLTVKSNFLIFCFSLDIFKDLFYYREAISMLAVDRHLLAMCEGAVRAGGNHLRYT